MCFFHLPARIVSSLLCPLSLKTAKELFHPILRSLASSELGFLLDKSCSSDAIRFSRNVISNQSNNGKLGFSHYSCRRHKLYENWTTVEHSFISKIDHFLHFFLFKISSPIPLDKKNCQAIVAPWFTFRLKQANSKLSQLIITTESIKNTPLRLV